MVDRIEVYRNSFEYVISSILAVLFLSGGIYMFIEGTPSNTNYYLAIIIVSLLVFLFSIFRIVNKKPLLIFNDKGIYFLYLDRIVQWGDINSVEVREVESEQEDSKTEAIQIVKKKYFSVFEITEKGPGLTKGYYREINLNKLNIEEEKLLEFANDFFQRYGISSV